MLYFILPTLLLTNKIFSVLITSVGKDRADFFAIDYLYLLGFSSEVTSGPEVCGFLFQMLLRIGCLICLCHSLSLPCNYCNSNEQQANI